MTRAGRPTRATADGRAYLDLQNLARRQERPTDELHQLYALEGFLSRLSASRHADRLILKGGMLLAAYNARRPTRDIDVQTHAIPDEHESVLALIQEVAAIQEPDGLIFDHADATAETIRDDAQYGGVRVTLNASLATAKLSLHVDINIGDPIWPGPRRIELPRLLGGTIALAGYPLPMVYAKKIVTGLQRGTLNTRWRDFADIYMLTGHHAVDGAELHRTLAEVAEYRDAELSPLGALLAGFGALAQSRWISWRRRQRLTDRLPASFNDVLTAVVAFADPAIDNTASGSAWDPRNRAWE